MAEPRPARNPWLHGSTLGAAALLALALFVMVNYLSLRHYQRFDWTSSQLYSLSEKSRNVVRGLDRQVDMVIFMNPASPLYDAVDELLSGYQAANPQRLTKREIDPAKNLLEAQRLVERYGIERENVVVLATEDDRRVIDESELAEYDYSTVQSGQPPKLEEFRGEQKITGALLALVEAKKPRVLFTVGHGEARIDGADARALTQARDLLGRDNFAIEEWSSLGKTEVPPDTDLLVIAGPRTNFLAPELETFTAYLQAGGRMLLMLDPVFAEGAGEPLVDLGLTDWLRGYGVVIRDDVVIDPASELPFFGPETIFTDAFDPVHPIVRSLDQTGTRVLLPLARSVTRADDPPTGYEITELVRTSNEGWGETNLTDLGGVARDDDDVPGPVSLGVAVSASSQALDPELDPDPDAELDEERSADEDGDQTRLVVFGDVDFAGDEQIQNGANGILLLNSLNWLVKREELIDVEPRRPEHTSLSLTGSELIQIFLLVMVGLPGLGVVLGIWVYVRRRR